MFNFDWFPFISFLKKIIENAAEKLFINVEDYFLSFRSIHKYDANLIISKLSPNCKIHKTPSRAQKIIRFSFNLFDLGFDLHMRFNELNI